MAGAIPDARLVVIPRAGHVIPIEAPGTVLSLLSGLSDRAFARANEGGATSKAAAQTQPAD